MEPARDVPLAPLCTMMVGGNARFLVEARSDDEVAAALCWAEAQNLAVRVLGGGSNVVVGDAGFPGLVVAVRSRGVSFESRADGAVLVSAAAGEPWDELVALTVARNLQGLECLSGIPGLVGASPIQNVGAYGQEVAETIERVRLLHRSTLEQRELPADGCGFAYRDSRFKSEEPERWVVLSVTYRLRLGAAPAVRYAELERHLAQQNVSPTVQSVRESVIALRRKKSMVLDRGDPNHRSCGSFFVNPVVPSSVAARVREQCSAPVPSWPQADGREKLAAGFLIEQAGFVKGTRRGNVGLSSEHALAIVCHQGALASDVLDFAREIQRGVRERFGVELTPEPNLWF